MRYRRKPLVFVFSFSLLILGAPGNLSAAGNTVWQIGIFNQSSHEFNSQAPVGNPNYNPVYTVDKSTANDWPARQPGSENKAEGLRPHPFTILFNLPSNPQGTYTLTISALLYEPRVPYLEVAINGREGAFHFPRKLSYHATADYGSSIDSGGEMNIVLPDSALHAGQNKLVLTALDNPKYGPGDSWFFYDALRLSHSSEARRFEPQVTLKPTIYYIRKDGRLDEQVRVTTNLGGKVRRGRVRLTVSGQHYKASLSPTPDFGEQRFEFLVPQLPGPTPAELTLHANGKTVRGKVIFQPERKWKLFLVPHEHLDVGYTDYRAKVYEVYDRNMDEAEDLA